MYLYLSLVEGKVAEFYHNMVQMTYFHRFLRTIDGVLAWENPDKEPGFEEEFDIDGKYCETMLE